MDDPHAIDTVTGYVSFTPKPRIYFDSKIAGFYRDQDFCRIGCGYDHADIDGDGDLYDTSFQYIVVCDGHGENDSYNKYFRPILNEMDFPVLLRGVTPVESIIQYVESKSFDIPQYFHNGATLSIAKIYNNDSVITVKCYNMGDSRCRVFLNDQLVYANIPHTIMSESEQNRLQARFECRNISVHPSSKNVIIDEDTIVREKSMRLHFRSPHMLWPAIRMIPTQCIGHNNVTGSMPDTFEREFIIPNDGGMSPFKLRVCVVSDGVDDMVIRDSAEDLNKLSNMNCDEIVEFAEYRWKKKWQILKSDKSGIYMNDDGTTPYKTGFDHLDDCAVGVWEYST